MCDLGGARCLADELAALIRRVCAAGHEALLLHAPDDARYGRVRHLQEALDLLLRRYAAVLLQIAEHAALRQRQVMLRKVGVGLYFDLVRNHF